MKELEQIVEEGKKAFWNLEQQEPEDYDRFLESFAKNACQAGLSRAKELVKEHDPSLNRETSHWYLGKKLHAAIDEEIKNMEV